MEKSTTQSFLLNDKSIYTVKYLNGMLLYSMEPVCPVIRFSHDLYCYGHLPCNVVKCNDDTTVCCKVYAVEVQHSTGRFNQNNAFFS